MTVFIKKKRKSRAEKEMYENLPRVGVAYALQCGPLNWKREGGDDEKDAELTMEDGELKLTGGRCLLVAISVDDGRGRL